jgi:tRNA pseudouridine55 synthase
MLEACKQYRATAHLGEATSTGDIEGEIIQTCPVPELAANHLSQVLNQFVGEIEQVPPMYSALKHEGKPLYEYARAGIEIDRPARAVTIHQLELVEWQPPQLIFDVRCSKGTYIRTLAEDIAKALDSCAHLVELRRTHVEPFTKLPMVTLEQLQEARDKEEGLQDFLLPIDVGLPGWPRVDLDELQHSKFMHGNKFTVSTNVTLPAKIRVYGPEGQISGLAEVSSERTLQPTRVFNL